MEKIVKLRDENRYYMNMVSTNPVGEGKYATDPVYKKLGRIIRWARKNSYDGKFPYIQNYINETVMIKMEERKMTKKEYNHLKNTSRVKLGEEFIQEYIKQRRSN